ncbi:hypothetical protein ACE1TF_08885 [Geomicrobium sp. JSM 1781026]|uniref:hypothetical protein n=1 Tax=unclassified Geomicrobium TaxID=2628951 RepID=UPI0005A5FCDC|nr:hypothetical protein [Geomicrobium sp. JCM 19037]
MTKYKFRFILLVHLIDSLSHHRLEELRIQHDDNHKLTFVHTAQAYLRISSIQDEPTTTRETVIWISSFNWDRLEFTSSLHLPERSDVHYAITVRFIELFTLFGHIEKRSLSSPTYTYTFQLKASTSQALLTKHLLDIKNDPIFKAVGFHPGIDCIVN